MLGFFDSIAIGLSLIVSLLVAVPFTGVLVRFRANYTPRGLALDNEGSAVPHTGPVVRSYFGMFKRVWQIEGVQGMYKGLMPTFLSSLLVTVIILSFLDTSRHGAYKAPVTGVIGTLLYSIGIMLLSLPSAVITYRAITTPHKLPYFKPMKSLRVLLTPTERRRPWIIYLTPGLLATESIHVAYVVLILGPLHRFLKPITIEPGSSLFEVSWTMLAIYFAVVLVSTVILAPLEVMSTRLAIQRNHSSSEYNSVTQEVEGEAEETAEFAGAEEDVIGLRNEADPYMGFVDCAKTIIEDEGMQAIYRGWWVTLLGGLISVF